MRQEYLYFFVFLSDFFSEQGIVVIWQDRDFPVPTPDRSANWAVKPESNRRLTGPLSPARLETKRG